MQILNPLYLWFLLGIPVLVIFYLLAPNVKTLNVSSLQFWAKRPDKGAKKFKWRKFYHNRHFYLQALSIVLLVCALLNPVINLYANSEDTHVLIMDTSLSMKSSEGDMTRMDLAKARALEKLAEWKNGKVVIIKTDAGKAIPSPNFQEPGEGLGGGGLWRFSSEIKDKEKIISVIRSIDAGDSSSQLIKAVQEGYAQIKGKGDITLFTDGASSEAIVISKRYPEVKIETAGKSNRNVSITSLIKTEYDNGVIAQVKNHGDGLEDIDVDVLVDGKSIGNQKVMLGSGEETPLYFSLPSDLFKESVVEARISTTDALPADNMAWYIWSAAEKASILLVTDGNKKMEEALKANKNWDINITKPEEFEKFSAKVIGFDLIIFDHYRPHKETYHYPAGRYGAIYIAPPLVPGEKVFSQENISIKDWDANHPVMRFIHPEEIRIQRASVNAPPLWAEVLLKGEIPLIYAMSESTGRSIVLGFDPSDSDFIRTPYFPLFMMNAVRWIKTGAEGEGIIAGNELKMKIPPSPPLSEELWITTPDGRKERVPVKDGFIRYPDTYKAGVYTIQYSGSNVHFEKRFAVNVDPAESDIGNVYISSGNTDSPATGDIHNKQSNITNLFPLWKILTLIALGVIVIEWGLRREGIRHGSYRKSLS